VINRWKKLCPSCFDALAEQAGVSYRLTDLEGMSWSEFPTPRRAIGERLDRAGVRRLLRPVADPEEHAVLESSPEMRCIYPRAPRTVI
jgi:hypothetical protein